jgi:hypothetical protein
MGQRLLPPHQGDLFLDRLGLCLEILQDLFEQGKLLLTGPEAPPSVADPPATAGTAVMALVSTAHGLTSLLLENLLIY